LDRAAVEIVSAVPIVIVRFFVADAGVGLVASVTVKVTLLVPDVVGVPVIAPVVAFRARPGGSPVADHAYGVLPPVAETVPL
jgi:hypothetical protein